MHRETLKPLKGFNQRERSKSRRPPVASLAGMGAGPRGSGPPLIPTAAWALCQAGDSAGGRSGQVSDR